MRAKIEKLFPHGKPVLGMLHLGGATPEERLARALAETRDMIAGGVDALVVENYFGDPDDVRRMLEAFERNAPGIVVGLNLLRDFRLGFELVDEFGLAFLQIDSVCGHLAPDEDADYAAELAERRAATDALLFGGVRFKYQPVKSGRSEEEDVRLGMARADALVVTGEATGQGTDNGKILRFRAVVGADYPLIVGAGMTAATAADQMRIADGAIVGSYFKDNHKDTGIVDVAHVRELMEEVRKVRGAPARIRIEPIDAAAFAPFGKVLAMGEAGDTDGNIIRTDGAGWSDAYTHDPLLATNASLGMTRSGGTPFEVRQMERHPNTQEALFCAEGPIVLVVAAAGPQKSPDARNLRAFAIPPGTVVVMHPGTWHDACRGLHGPTTYYWMATVRTGAEWQDVEGGPVCVVAEPAA